MKQAKAPVVEVTWRDGPAIAEAVSGAEGKPRCDVDIVQEVERLQRTARQKRRTGDLQAAEVALRKSAELLQPELDRLRSEQEISPDSPASEPLRRIAELLADSLGSLAGVVRRRGSNQEALKLYKRGKTLEEDDSYRIASTYNRVQWLVLSILESPDALTSSELQADIHKTLRVVERAAKTGDPWRYADLALLDLLAGNRDDAFDALDVMKSLNPVADVYKSGLPVLEQLSKVLPADEGLRDARDWYDAEVNPASPQP